MRDAAERPAAVRIPAAARRGLDWVQRVFTPVALAFLVYVGWEARDTLEAVFAQARPGYLTLSVALWALLNVMAPYVTTRILHACGEDLDYATALRVYARRLPGRYVPGGIWHTVGRTVDYYRHGIPPRPLTALVMIEGAVPAAAAFVLGGLGMALFDGQTLWPAAGAAAAAVALAGLAVLPALIRRRVLAARPCLAWRAYAIIVLWYGIYWLIATAAFLLYIAAFPALASGSWAAMGAAYLFAWAVGNVAVFAPQGIGVFEIVAGRLVAASMPLGSAAVLIAGFRVVGLVADVLVWAMSYRRRGGAGRDGR